MKHIRYTGPADFKILTQEDMADDGLDNPTLVWSRENAFMNYVGDDIAAYLLARADYFVEWTGATYADIYFSQFDSTITNIADFGLEPDDPEVDASAAFAEAFLRGREVWIPAGHTYYVEDLRPPLGAVIRGGNRGGYEFPTADLQAPSRLKLLPGSDKHLIVGESDCSHVRIEDLELHGNWTNAPDGGDAIHLLDDPTDSESHWSISRCYIHRFRGKGIYIGTTRRANRIINTVIHRNGEEGVWIAASDQTLDHCIVGQSGNFPDSGVRADGIVIADDVVHLIGNDIFLNRRGIRFQSNRKATTIVGNGIDRNDQVGIYLNTGNKAITIVGNNLHTNSQQTNDTYANIELAAGAQCVLAANTHSQDGSVKNPSYGVFLGNGARAFGLENEILQDIPAVSGAAVCRGLVNRRVGFSNLPNSDMLSAGESNIDRRLVTTTATLTSGRLLLSYFTAALDEAIGSVRFGVGTAHGSTTRFQIVVYSADDATLALTQLGATANETSILASTGIKTIDFAADWNKYRGVRLAVGVLWVGTGSPALYAASNMFAGLSEVGVSPRLIGKIDGLSALPSSPQADSGVTDAQATLYTALVP
jgi:hypothetical protein